MTDSEDRSNRLLLRAINILLLNNPERTVLGVLLGIVFSFLFKLFAPTLKTIKSIDVIGAPEVGWVALGIILLNLPTVLAKIVRPPKINEQVDALTRLIEQGNFSDAEKRRMYRDLVCKVLANVTLKGNFSSDFIKVKKDFMSENSTD